MRVNFLSLSSLLALLACSGKNDDTGTDTGDTGGGNGTDGARTLANCETNIDDDVPEFYQTYFRCVDISMSGDAVVIQTADLPPHLSPYYAESDENWTAFDERGGSHFQNPNQLSAQDLQVTIPADPTPKDITITEALVDGTAGNGDEYRGATTGIALDSVALFHGVAAPGDLIEDEAYTFDLYEGHPQGEGAYHYHSPSPGPLEVLEAIGLTDSTTPGSADIEVYGIMCDGTVVLGCTELDGSVPSGSLDAQGGHAHDIADEAGTVHFSGRYHTHICADAVSEHIFTPEIQYHTACTN